MAETWSAVTPVEYGQGEQKKTRWVRVGAAWRREDGGFSVALDAAPLNGKLLIMPPRENDRGHGGGF
jgi:hypothetical protein